jgi:hypothetical protein
MRIRCRESLQTRPEVRVRRPDSSFFGIDLSIVTLLLPDLFLAFYCDVVCLRDLLQELEMLG